MMSPIESQPTQKLDVLRQMAGENHALAAPDRHDIALLSSAGSTALLAAAAIFAPGSLNKPEVARAAEPSTAVINAEFGDFNTNGKPDVRSTIRFFDHSDRIGLHHNGGTTITWDILWRGMRSPFPSQGQNPNDTVMDFGNIPDLVTPYDPNVVSASPAYQQGIPYVDSIVTHTMDIPEGYQVVNPDGTFVVEASLRNYEAEGVVTTNPIIVDSTPGGNEVPGPGPVPVDPTTLNPPKPVNILSPELKMTTAKILPKNRRGKLAVTTSVSSDSTCSIDGADNGADKNPKLRRQAARIEVKMSRATNIGKLPKGMIALFNGKAVKKGKKANMVSIDVRNSGLNPGNRQINRFNYQLLGKTGKFAGRLIVPVNRSDCGAALTSTNLLAKSR